MEICSLILKDVANYLRIFKYDKRDNDDSWFSCIFLQHGLPLFLSVFIYKYMYTFLSFFLNLNTKQKLNCDRIMATSKTSFRKLKILLVGDAGTGKHCYVRRLIDKKYPRDSWTNVSLILLLLLRFLCDQYCLL